MGKRVALLLGERVHCLYGSQLGSGELSEACLRFNWLFVGDLCILGHRLAAKGLAGASFRFGRAFHLKCNTAI